MSQNLTDVQYAIKQLRGIDWATATSSVIDRRQRALDALERVEERLTAIEVKTVRIWVGDEDTGVEDADVPEGVRVLVYDYSAERLADEAADSPRRHKDFQGNEYLENILEPGPSYNQHPEPKT